MSNNARTKAEERLLSEVQGGNIRGVERALAAGASVNGSGKLAGMPLMAAVIYGRISIAKRLIEKGADLELSPQPNAHYQITHTGVRVVTFAAGSGQLDILRMLLQAGANPNSADEFGRTPLMEACRQKSAQRVLIVRELLKRGADATQRDKDGEIALHYAAILGHVEMMGPLLSQAPATLNYTSQEGITPLGAAACRGRDDSVSHLLSVGASNRSVIAMTRERGVEDYNCPLKIAVIEGFENVVRVLLDDGLDAIGGLSVIPSALLCALQSHRSRILHRLLNVEGERRQRYWATCCYKGDPMVYFASAHVDPAGMSVLLAAGADETTLDSDGRRARDVVGLGSLDEEKDAAKEAAVLRALERGPAFRAQSWRWPSTRDTCTTTAGDAGDAGDAVVAGGAVVAGAVAAAADTAPSSSRAPRARLDVRVSRPRDRKLFGKIVGRYAAKL